MRSATAILIVAVALAAPAATALEVTTARDARNMAAPFDIKLEAAIAAMEAAYNSLLDSIRTCGAKGSAYGGPGAVGADADNCIASVPAGTVAMFKTDSCPAGWTRDGWWDNRFPMGASSNIGGTGGSSSVKLNSNHLPKHRHDIKGWIVGLVKKASSDSHARVGVLSNSSANNPKATTFRTEYEGSSSSFDIRNPYRRTLFCRKQ